MGLRDHGPPPRARHGSRFADVFTRGIAFGLDAAIIYLAVGAVFLCRWAVYLTAFWTVADQTPGIWWMRIVVERMDGGDVG